MNGFLISLLIVNYILWLLAVVRIIVSRVSYRIDCVLESMCWVGMFLSSLIIVISLPLII